MRAAVLSAVVAMIVIGCGAPREKQSEATRTLPSITPPPDSSTPAIAGSVPGDRVTRASSKAGAQAETEAGENALRDSAFGPKFTVDPNGKVKPITRP